MRTLTAPFSNLTNAQRSLRKKISGQRPNTEKKHSGFKAQIKNLRNRLISFLRNKRNNIVVIIMSEPPSFPPASAPPLRSDAPLSNSEPSPPLPRPPSSAVKVLAPLPLDPRNLSLVEFPRPSCSDEGKFAKSSPHPAPNFKPLPTPDWSRRNSVRHSGNWFKRRLLRRNSSIPNYWSRPAKIARHRVGWFPRLFESSERTETVEERHSWTFWSRFCLYTRYGFCSTEIWEDYD
ncbi:hypothetical protein RUND412_003856 [Rhizina undulata]